MELIPLQEREEGMLSEKVATIRADSLPQDWTLRRTMAILSFEV